MYNHGDTKLFGNHRFTMVSIVGDKKGAEAKAENIRKEGYLARITVRSKRHVPKEPSGSYFGGHGGFTVTTYCVWKGAKK
jgi:hypothetical protein